MTGDTGKREVGLDRRAVLGGVGLALTAGSALADTDEDGGVRVPLVVRRGQPLVAVELNGRGPFTFLVDTGAGAFGITAQAARKAGLPQAARMDISGVSGGVVSVASWFARDVRVGGAFQLGLSRFSEDLVGGLDGLIPGDAFLAQPVRFALADGEMRIYPKRRPDVSGVCAPGRRVRGAAQQRPDSLARLARPASDRRGPTGGPPPAAGARHGGRRRPGLAAPRLGRVVGTGRRRWTRWSWASPAARKGGWCARGRSSSAG